MADVPSPRSESKWVSRFPMGGLLSVAIAFFVYASGYVLLLEPIDMLNYRDFQSFRRIPQYRFQRGAGRHLSLDILFAPAHWVDQQIRPEFWSRTDAAAGTPPNR